MRIVCAPDSFKGSLSALDAAHAMARGVRRVQPEAEAVCCPVADGGEGTVHTLVAATGGELRRAQVTGPRGRLVEAEWGWLGGADKTAVIEMAAAAGLTLLPASEHDPLRTSTFGTGQLIAAALDAGANRIILGLGGSATNDGGCGAAQAVGVAFIDQLGARMERPITGADLPRIARIDTSSLDPRLRNVALALCRDVDNPLTGRSGAAAVYGPQKGADADMVDVLDAGLLHLGTLWRDQLNHDIADSPGAGAAGGMGGGMIAMLGATTQRGIDLILKACHFDEKLAGATLCLTGEGRLDSQSTKGKACFGVTRAAAVADVPVTGFFGSIAADAPDTQTRRALGMTHCHTIAANLGLDDSMRHAADLLEDAVATTLTDK